MSKLVPGMADGTPTVVCSWGRWEEMMDRTLVFGQPDVGPPSGGSQEEHDRVCSSADPKDFQNFLPTQQKWSSMVSKHE